MFEKIRGLIFKLDPETAHNLAIKGLKLNYIPKKKVQKNEILEVDIFGKKISNPIGIAAGFDKDGEVYNSLFKLGFGFVEVGTVTPRPQKGNPKPRIHRIKKERAIINSLGFNSIGFEKVKVNLLNKKTEGIIGVNIGANKDSKIFIDDYISGIKFF